MPIGFFFKRLFGVRNKYTSSGNPKIDTAFNALIGLADKYGRLTCEDGGQTVKDKIIQKAHDLREPIFIMIVGAGNAGKSSLTNALIGQDLAKVKAVPYTWKIDIFAHTKGRKYAKLVYEKEGVKYEKKCSFKKATKIVAKEDKVRKKHEKSGGDEWKSPLKAIWWYVKTENIHPNFCFVDTPGIDQLRVDSSAKIFSLFDASGIKIAKEDSFDYYYYRSNIVLWCIDSGTIEARDNLEKLKQYKNGGKKIIGILTKIDTNQKHLKASEIINYAKSVYSGYIDEFLVSGCRDESVKAQTIPLISKTIDTYIQKNESTIKLRDASEFAVATFHEIADDMEKICEMRLGNHVLCNTVLSSIRYAYNEQLTAARTTASSIAKGIINYVGNRLDSLYDSNDSRFSSNVNDALVAACNDSSRVQQRKSFCDLFAGELKRKVNSINWKTVIVGADHSTSSVTSVSEFTSNYISDCSFSINLSDSDSINYGTAYTVGAAAGIIGAIAFGPIGLAAAFLGALFGPSKQEKVAAMRKELDKRESAIYNMMYSSLTENLSSIFENTTKNVERQYKAINDVDMNSARSVVNADRANLEEVRRLTNITF